MATDFEGLRLSNSKLKTWRRCPKQFDYKYQQKLRPKQRAVALARGSWLHLLIEEHYKGNDWREAQEAQTAQFNKLFLEEKEDLGDLPAETERIMTNYLLHWRDEDAKLKTIDTEVDEIIELPNGLRFQFIIDWIFEDERGGVWLGDHKTVKNFMDADYMLLDAQLARYFWCAEKKLGIKNLRGVIFNELRTKPPTVPRVLKSGRLSEAQNIDTDVYTYFRAIKEAGQNPADYRDILLRLKRQTEKWFRRTKMPKDKTLTQQLMSELVMGAREIQRAQKTNQFPRTVDKSCVWGCDYMEPCVTELHGGDASAIIKHKYETHKKEE